MDCWCTNVRTNKTVAVLFNTTMCSDIICIHFLVISFFLIKILGEEYIKSLIANPELVDRLALSNDDQVNTKNILSYQNVHGNYSYFSFW